MKKWNVVLGIYQNSSTAKTAIQDLKRQGFCRLASIYYDTNQKLHVKKYFTTPAYISIALSCFFALLFALIFFIFPNAFDAEEDFFAVLTAIGVVAAITWILGVSVFRISPETVNKLKKCVFPEEVLVVAELQSEHIKEAFSVLGQASAGHPITFLLSNEDAIGNSKKILIPKEPEAPEQFRQTAIGLANSTQESIKSLSGTPLLLGDLSSIETRLQTLHQRIMRSEYIELPAPQSSDWFLDNMPVIQGSIEEIKGNLSKKFYQELPKVLSNGKELPRIYVIASELVQSTAGKVNRQNIADFITSYQTVLPLTIGELWALPLMLKFCLLEWVQFLATHIAKKMRTDEIASFWGNRLLHASQRTPDKLPALMKFLIKEVPTPNPHFAEELIDHLFDEETALSLVKQWLETRFDAPLTEVFHKNQVNETLEHFIFSSAMSSLVGLSQIAWQDVFEQLSAVDSKLREDPAGIYADMDFHTRDHYRKVIEQLQRQSHLSEIDIAQKCVFVAQGGTDDVTKHVGYYLIDAGRPFLENTIAYHTPFKQRLQNVIKFHPCLTYLGTILLATLGLESLLLIHVAKVIPSSFTLTILAVLALIPLSEIVIQLLNFLLVRFLPPAELPKMEYKQEIPAKCKTLVVVPTMLVSEESIQEEVNHLEIRYLANSEPGILFGLFSDFKDAPQQHLERDQALIDLAIKEIQTLDLKYGPGKFFLFHRQRVWSNSENAWIGWERKRGKLECLNRYLVGEPLSENILYSGNANNLKDICYVITLDSDTQLAKDQGKKLIEIFSHPLNRPVLKEGGKSLVRGYTIIQPTVCTDFWHTKNSLFLEIFSDPSVIDPYTHVVSNLYQDLTGEASYHGKGIYDLKAFHSILTDRSPSEHILSHDLIEGAYVRVGSTAAVCLYDSFPENYLGFSNRQRRWIRGDWQIIDWLFPSTPTNNSHKEKNPLSLFNRWKIFDNLRRSLIPVSTILLLVVGWLFAKDAALWTVLGLTVIFLAPVLQFLQHLFKITSYKSLSSWHEVKLSFLRTLISTSMLPQEAYFSLDSIFRVFYRRLVSHHQLLEWTTSTLASKSAKNFQKRFLWKLCLGSLFACAVLVGIFFLNPLALFLALPFCLLWMAGPGIIEYISQPIDNRIAQEISEQDRYFLRRVARKTWRYFDDFVGIDTNWLPPDNYQAILNVGIAPRTSPTNIGLWLIAVLNAYDLKYVTCDRVIDKINATFDTLNRLERFEGHFLNWYDILTLKPLFPRYISTVDSGNLLACLWTIQQGLYEISSSPLIAPTALAGVEDLCRMISDETKGADKSFPALHELKEIAAHPVTHVSSFIATINKFYEVVQNTNVANQTHPDQVDYWLKALEKQLGEWQELISRYYKWAPLLTSLTDDNYRLIHIHASTWKDTALNTRFSLRTLAEGQLNTVLNPLIEASQKQELPSEIRVWSGELKEAITSAQWLAGEKLAQYNQALSEIDKLSNSMNLSYLYNKERKLFAIGYNVDDARLDQSSYDLLASEARLASMVAIAKDEVPLDHWWALGRPYGLFKGKRVLLSWGGTMFEYLMPVLFNKHSPNSLLGNACEAAVDCQILYGNSRGIPWGISESAYSAIDAHKIYQYRSFGVPGLGLKRGLEKDLVVSPYSTLLALMINPEVAIANLHRLAESNNSLWGSYGYYESIDFTRQADQEGGRGVVVETFMVHHQGMGLTAINNLLNNDVIAKRFHKDPRISGVEFILFERRALNTPITTKLTRKKRSVNKLKPFSTVPIMGISETPNTQIPKVSLLSNHKYSIVITNSGGGYSRWGNIDVTRWRSDTTCDRWGSFYYIKNALSQQNWSATFQPLLKEGSEYSSSFKAGKVEFRRRDEDIETFTEIVVSPEDDAEIRYLTFTNKGAKTGELEITSYHELALATHATDRAHPAFNKLFIETEAMPELHGLIAFRRLRAPDDQPIWAAHLIAFESPSDLKIQFETSRARFIGRGRSLQNPVALENDLTNTVGTVLDPIFSIRHRISIEPGKQVKVSYVTLIADSRPQLISLMEKYQDIKASHRAIEMAWTYSQLELRHLSITSEDVQLFRKLAGRILYPHFQLRASQDRLASNKLGQSRLWSYGISGDLPLVVISIDDAYSAILVKQMLIAHSFWCLRGLKVDLLILNEEEIGYENPLQDQLVRLINTYAFGGQINAAGGVYLKSSKQIPEDDLTLILAVASVFLVAARGYLRQQLVSPMPAMHYPPKLIIKGLTEEVLSSPLPYLELPFFNGLGGYSPDGKTYDIYLGPNTQTPAPWINVIANAQFGTLVSEAGNGSTWYGNSQSNRLTPWSNDPVIDPIADAIYIRDEKSGTFWTPTPSPVRELDAYRVCHGQGYTLFEHNSHGIEQELLILVPTDDRGGIPLRIQRLKLHNISSTARQLTITAYHELILGTNKEETQMHVVTEWNAESQALFAYNHYNTPFEGSVAFSKSIPAASSYTGDRTEFIGRNGLLSSPVALKRSGLSEHVGAGFDPCAALQVPLVLEPGATKEIIFVLGYAKGVDEAKALISQADSNEKIEHLIASTKSWWDTFLEAVQVDVPDLMINFAMNRWLPYQNLCCRIWGRTAFYQSSGAYGFRDQLQDGMALVYSSPHLAREHILVAAARQFVEGDVQHWWDPITGSGIRTRYTDDLLWLPFTVAQYVRTTGDLSVLEEEIPFLKAPILEKDQHEIYSVPEITTEKASLLEHCQRAIKKGITSGAHGLPLMGGGDWNDGMNRVGIEGKGESVWLAWFLIHVLHDFVELLEKMDLKESTNEYAAEAERLAKAIEANAWDGAWYRRAYYDNGSPLGSKECSEASIDSLAQSWAVISGAGDPKRSDVALKSAFERLVNVKERIVLLLTPPFDKTPQDPGYIKGYPPGVRENGGQYTHGSLWLAMAYARKGDGNTAVDLLKMMHPHWHTRSSEETQKYKKEPYVLAGDVYELASEVGLGGWSWYTGSSAWMYRIWLEEILGFKLLGNKFRIACCIPKEWNGFKIRYRYHTSFYEIQVENPDHVNQGIPHIQLDGKELQGQDVPLVDDNKTHTVHIVLKAKS